MQPYIALGTGLRAAGHVVTLATLAAFAPMVAAYGLGFQALRGEFLELLQTAEGKAALVGKGNPLALLQQVKPMLHRILEDALGASEGTELVLYHPKALAGYSIAESQALLASWPCRCRCSSSAWPQSQRRCWLRRKSSDARYRR